MSKIAPVTRFTTALFFFASVLGGVAQAQDVEPAQSPVAHTESQKQGDPIVGLGGLIGFQAEPTQFAVAGHADFYLSNFLSLGPLAQAGFASTRTFFLLTFGGKLHLAVPSAEDLEFTVQAGAGYFYREASGFQFNNFTVTLGPGMEYRIDPRVKLEAMFLANATNDLVDDLFVSALVGAKYLF